MKFVIITGLSGAGKTQVIHFMEDLGYYCVDNMPPVLLGKFVEICNSSGGKIDKVALVIDIRGGDMFHELLNEIESLESMGCNFEILFLEADDDVLVKRYKETRRKHPLAKDGASLLDGIREERKILDEVKKRADNVINTSNIKTTMLKTVVQEIFDVDGNNGGIVINVQSFGYKYGIIIDGDLVFDVRFLPNPFYEEDLKEHTGLEECVQEYVMKFEQTNEFLEKLEDMIKYLVPYYIEEGKTQLVIGIGCTGGKHRSVTLAIKLYEYLKKIGYNTIITHRDVLRQND